MSGTTEASELTYGGLRRPQSPGLAGLKLIPSIGVFAGLGIAILLMMFANFWWALGFAAVAMVAALPAVITHNDRSWYSTLVRSYKFRRATKRDWTRYQSGLAGVTKSGTRSLPGLLAKVETWDAQDSDGRDFALVHIKAANQWAVVLSVSPQGGALVDPEVTDEWVANFGEYLAALGQEGGVAQSAVVIETVPYGGALLEAHVESLLHPDAPPFARQVMTASAQELPRGVTETIGYVAVTFNEAGLGIDRKEVREELAIADAAASEVARRLPALSASLRDAGAAGAEPMTVSELSRRVLEAFDPDAALSNAQMDAEGHTVDIRWEDSGPSSHDERATYYTHDSGTSRSLEAMRMPTGIFTDGTLRKLLSPIKAASSKRVVLYHYPVDAGNAARVVDMDLKAANARASAKNIGGAHLNLDLAGAQQAATEEAHGAGVTAMSMTVTVTVPAGDIDALDQATASIERIAKGSRFRLAVGRGAQSALFSAGLGVGLSLPDLSVIPAAAREHI